MHWNKLSVWQYILWEVLDCTQGVPGSHKKDCGPLDLWQNKSCSPCGRTRRELLKSVAKLHHWCSRFPQLLFWYKISKIYNDDFLSRRETKYKKPLKSQASSSRAIWVTDINPEINHKKYKKFKNSLSKLSVVQNLYHFLKQIHIS